MIFRTYVEKKPEFAEEARHLFHELKQMPGFDALESVRVINRYDAEGLSEEMFQHAVKTVFSEPQVDLVHEKPDIAGAQAFVVEALPGQFDQRADSAAQCIQILSQKERPIVRSAKVYALYGDLSEESLDAVKRFVINPVEAREASWEIPLTLSWSSEKPDVVATVEGLMDADEEDLRKLLKDYAFAMDLDDLRFCQSYFRSENRNPTLTEMRVIDTYWSDHCRHTTFQTELDSVRFEEETLQMAFERYLSVRKQLGRRKPICLMDVATIAARYLKKQGKLDKLDESEEINACTVKIDVDVDGVSEPWLLLFKNETHNHPTEIEPFGGAATCIGGAIRDPLSGRSYVYAAMRVTGAADPRKPLAETLPGKLPQKKIVTTAAAGYSSYGNQIGLATGIVDEIYHEGYEAKRMEIGAVIAAAPEKNVRREKPAPGDAVILLGGRTGRDGCGGATGSSKSHTLQSLELCGAEVQKGNAPEERKLQRLFRNPEVCRMIKRCNDFGAGGISVAIGELAPGLDIRLDAVPKKYEGLDGTELAISESQERMAIVIERDQVDAMIRYANAENVEATLVATVTEKPRLVMHWQGQVIVDISREFLDSNGASKHVDVDVESPKWESQPFAKNFSEGMRKVAEDLNTCSKRGLSERFDSTVGAGSILMPFGGRMQRTPIQAMVHQIPLEKGHTDSCSFMAWGYNPKITEQSPYHGAYLAVVESVSKLISTGASFTDVYLSFQEYFERLEKDPKRWGKPLAALLGALDAQLDLEVGAIGGKDSMSGSFEDRHVPPTLVSFAVTTGTADTVCSPEFKKAGNLLYWIQPHVENQLPKAKSLRAIYAAIHQWIRDRQVVSAYTIGMGGIGEAVMKMSFGNQLGAVLNSDIAESDLFRDCYGSFIVETKQQLQNDNPLFEILLLGTVTANHDIVRGEEKIAIGELLERTEAVLEGIFPNHPNTEDNDPAAIAPYKGQLFTASHGIAAPKALIPVFPGTNCEYESARSVTEAGAKAEIFVINNQSASSIQRSVEAFAEAMHGAQMVFIPGGFSGGDEPDGSGKFITAFFQSAPVREAVEDLMDHREGLMLGICNGFQALIKLGLLPYGHITEPAEDSPTLTFNTIGRHQSKIVRTRIVSTLSPWLSQTQPGEIYSVPISHGEGRLIADDLQIRRMTEQGQIATQYVDLQGNASNAIQFNPNGSMYAIEGITSPDGRILGKMGHSERIGKNLYRNVPGRYDIHLFDAAVRYFRGN
ncbi:MAG: phosphoribosylformylglycinamidine synthase [Peptoniphilaceae bacterium]|nr:phosphoribosylformylglycinamidine synthase [Peptoniphilaceae bacterium]MDY5766361.1 phosphoribosylformylglycinamidine synthase [Peptoniphilaceae bacterium]